MPSWPGAESTEVLYLDQADLNGATEKEQRSSCAAIGCVASIESLHVHDSYTAVRLEPPNDLQDAQSYTCFIAKHCCPLPSRLGCSLEQ